MKRADSTTTGQEPCEVTHGWGSCLDARFSRKRTIPVYFFVNVNNNYGGLNTMLLS